MINEYHYKKKDVNHSPNKKQIQHNNNTTNITSTLEFTANEKRLHHVTYSTWKLPFKDKVLPISMAAIKEEFRRLDILSEKKITYLNLKSALELREVRETDHTIRTWFREYDRNNKGYIDFNDYLSIYENSNNNNNHNHILSNTNNKTIKFEDEINHKSKQQQQQERLNLLRKAFDTFDIDKDGYISMNDLQISFTNQGKAYTNNDLLTWIQTRDQTNHGSVSFNDFSKHYK